MFCSKDKNKAEFKNLDNFDVLSSDFEALKTPAASLTSSASAASLVSATSTTPISLFPYTGHRGKIKIGYDLPP